MEAYAQESAGRVFDRHVVTWSDSTVAPIVADTLSLWANLFQWDYLLSRPLED